MCFCVTVCAAQSRTLFQSLKKKKPSHATRGGRPSCCGDLLVWQTGPRAGKFRPSRSAEARGVVSFLVEKNTYPWKVVIGQQC